MLVVDQPCQEEAFAQAETMGHVKDVLTFFIWDSLTTGPQQSNNRCCQSGHFKEYQCLQDTGDEAHFPGSISLILLPPNGYSWGQAAQPAFERFWQYNVKKVQTYRQIADCSACADKGCTKHL